MPDRLDLRRHGAHPNMSASPDGSPLPTDGAGSPLSRLIATVATALHLRFDPAQRNQFITELRHAQAAIDAFVAAPDNRMSPATRERLLRLGTNLEIKLIASARAAQKHDFRCRRDRRARPAAAADGALS